MKAYISNIARYLPLNIEKNVAGRLSKIIGINQRHIADDNELASDLAVKACENLFSQGVDKDEIDYILYCTESPDYILPSTACILQERLGISKSVGALQYNLGCSGYVYGLSLAKGLIETGQAKNVLLITSEVLSKYVHSKDEALKPIIGDGAAATLIKMKKNEKSGVDHFVFGTDGKGYDNLIIPVGGLKSPYEKAEIVEESDENGHVRTKANLYMNGFAVGVFSLNVVPDTIDNILLKAKLNKDEIDYYVFHQPNKFMLDSIQNKCELTEVPFWNNIKEYGNTGSSSIPFALVDIMQNTSTENLNNVMLVGFGVGLSWAGCIVDLKYCRLQKKGESI